MQAPTMGSYLDAQMRLIACGWLILYQKAGDAYRVSIIRSDEEHNATGLLTWSTVRLADRYAKGAR